MPAAAPRRPAAAAARPVVPAGGPVLAARPVPPGGLRGLPPAAVVGHRRPGSGRPGHGGLRDLGDLCGGGGLALVLGVAVLVGVAPVALAVAQVDFSAAFSFLFFCPCSWRRRRRLSFCCVGRIPSTSNDPPRESFQ